MELVFKNLLQVGEYEKAEVLIQKEDDSQINALIMNYTYDAETTENMSILGFISYMICKNNNEFWYDLMITLLINQFSYLEGAYSLAFFYAKNVLKFNRSIRPPRKLISGFEINDTANQI